jgi:L-malate glycosyltransferase
MQVLHVVKSLGRGGAELLLLEGLRASTAATEQRFAYFLPWKDALVRPLQELGADVRCFPARGAGGMAMRVSELARAARTWRTDIIHSHLPLAGAVARLAGQLSRIPVVYSEHNLQERYHPATRAANLATWHLQARVIAVSDDVRASAERAAATSVPIQVVKNGVSLHHFRRDNDAGRAVRQQLGVPPNAPLIGTVAVFRTQKRLDLWLQAAALTRQAHPNAHFLMVGDGPLRADVERWIAHHRLQGAVHLVGLQEEVRPYLSAMDLYMMSSEFEGLPVALLEAMAMELPVVVTRVGGIPEVVRDGEAGRVVQSGAPHELARALASLLSSDAERRAMAVRARSVVAAGFAMDRMQRELEEVYELVLSESSSRRVA